MKKSALSAKLDLCFKGCALFSNSCYTVADRDRLLRIFLVMPVLQRIRTCLDHPLFLIYVFKVDYREIAADLLFLGLPGSHCYSGAFHIDIELGEYFGETFQTAATSHEVVYYYGR